MSGAEYLPAAASAARKAVKKAVEESEGEKAQLSEAAKGHPAMDVAIDAYARRLAVRQTVLLKLFKPLARLVGIQREYFEVSFPGDLASKTSHIPDENLRTPPASVVVPAMQGLGYSLEEPSLKEMYLNLIATATDDRRESEAHPSFAEVIKQLSADEASALTWILKMGHQPLAQVRVFDEDHAGYHPVYTHLTPWVNADTGEPARAEESAVSIDNWVRLGLVTATYDAHMIDDAAYQWCETHPDYTEAVAAAEGTRSVSFARGVLAPTSFGRRFIRAVSDDGADKEVGTEAGADAR